MKENKKFNKTKILFLFSILLFICGAMLSACNSDFIKATKKTNFNNVTVSMERFESSVLHSTTFLEIGTDKTYMKITDCMTQNSTEIYIEKQRDGSAKYYSKQAIDEETTYSQESNRAVTLFVTLLTRFDDYKKSDFDLENEYFVIKDNAKEKSEYSRLVNAFVIPLFSYNLKFKIQSNKLTEVNINYISSTSISDGHENIEGVIICAYTKYGTTMLSAPDWVSLC